MWCTWATLLLVSCSLVTAEIPGADAETTRAPGPAPTTDHYTENPSETTVTTVEPEDSTVAEGRLAVATTRAPLRTLDRQAAELAWRTWLQSAESGNQNAPPRRITTKSLFITPLVCPKGQRLDRNGCVQVVTVNKDEHERILLEQLNALFSSPSTGDVMYDYGDDEPGPLQLSIPISLEPQAAPLLTQEPSAQAQELQTNYVKKDEIIPNSDASIEAELELLKLQHSQNNYTHEADIFNHNVMNAFLQYGDKPKRDSADVSTATNNTDTGQKELVYGHVNVDPILYNEHQNIGEEVNTKVDIQVQNNYTNNGPNVDNVNTSNIKITATSSNIKPTKEGLSNSNDHSKLNPENDYSDIGEAIKLISRYAEVSTDENFNKDQTKLTSKEDSVLGTRTKLQYRRNKPKPEKLKESLSPQIVPQQAHTEKELHPSFYSNNDPYYRYPWPSQYSQTPPPNYPFRHIQDYWPGKHHIGGVYNSHGNPRRHHHSYPHYFRPRGYYPEPYPRLQEYPEKNQGYAHKVVQRHVKPSRSQTNNQNLYSLLGLRHWFSSEGISKR